MDQICCPCQYVEDNDEKDNGGTVIALRLNRVEWALGARFLRRQSKRNCFCLQTLPYCKHQEWVLLVLYPDA